MDPRLRGDDGLCLRGDGGLCLRVNDGGCVSGMTGFTCTGMMRLAPIHASAFCAATILSVVISIFW